MSMYSYKMKRFILLKRKRLLFYIAAFCLFLALIIGLGYRESKMGQGALDRAAVRKIHLSCSEYPYYTHTLSTREMNESNLKYNCRYTKDMRIQKIPPSDIYSFVIEYNDGSAKTIKYSRLMNKYYDGESRLIKPSRDFEAQLQEWMRILDVHLYNKYGMLLPWEEVDKIFPRFSYARIIDIYTGASFMVQRRAGTSHVDAQPLTAQDTAVMKKIFHGSWTWDRSGIVVQINQYRIAASMNGKPHGSGKIKGNNFPGHFCIHFLNSTTHSGNLDQQHLVEILKAAGKLPLTE